MDTKKQVHRSPAYPAFSLKQAIEKARTFFQKEGKHEAAVNTAAIHWGLSATSSTRLTTVAALKAFGLMSDSGELATRKVQLTPLGLSIIQDERKESPERDMAIKQAALRPKIIAELWAKYGNELPSHDTLVHFLKVEKSYNPNSVEDVIRIYKETVSFAGLGVSSSQPAVTQPPEGETVEQVVEPVAPIPTGATVTKIVTPNVGQQAIAGEIANIRVARDCTIRLIATGPYSRKSIEALVAQLELGLKLGSYDDISDATKLEN